MRAARLNFFIVVLIVLVNLQPARGQSLSLAGTWQFRSDRNDEGIREQWYNQSFSETIRLPGSMLTNHKGDIPSLTTNWTGSIYDSSWFFNPRFARYRQAGNLFFPFWLTPEKYYSGPAWYQKDIIIPANWDKQSIRLYLERVHIISTVWVDGTPAGSQNSLAAAHVYDLTPVLSPGKHRITIRVDNRIKEINVGPDSHSVTDHTQGNWNGIIGKIELQLLPALHISGIQVYPDIERKEARVRIRLSGKPGEKHILRLSAGLYNSSIQPAIPAITQTVFQQDSIDMILPMGTAPRLWDEFNPSLYQLTVTFSDVQGKNKEIKTLLFGMRKFGIVGTRFTVNNRPVFLRGTLNNCEFPLTGFPPTDINSWRRIFTIARSHGLNHMRFHSWCPPEAAFTAADLEGFYLQPEVDSWPNHGTSLGDGRFIDQYIYTETQKIIDTYGNHPSFCMLAACNEPAGSKQAKWLAEFIKYCKALDPRHLYTGASVAMSWPLVPENDFMVKSGARNLSWNNRLPESDSDYRKAIEPYQVPYVTHEQGQWCVFPDFREIKKYTGVYRAKNFEMFQQDLIEQGMGDQATLFTMASGKLQTICYKNEIEKSLRTPGLAGFQLLGLQDFPGQGSAIIGTLNAFWEEKGYTSPAAFHRFCSSTVPLIRTPKFVYTNNEILEATVEIFHFGNKDLTSAVVLCRLLDGKGQLVAEKKIPTDVIAAGKNTVVGAVAFNLATIPAPAQLKLEISIRGTSFSNDWNVWVYPAQLPVVNDNSIYYTDTLDAKAEAVLRKGGNVYLQAAGKVVKGKEIIQQFTPVFWNTSWFKMRPPHTTGFLVNPVHPAFRYFPTEFHSNLQWWEIVNKAQVMHLEDFPKKFRPLLQPIDTWFMNRRLAMIFEVKIGKGKLLVCSADLENNLDARPAARQLKFSLKQYMLSAAFNPSTEINLETVRDIFRSPSKYTFDAYTRDSPDELKPKLNLSNTKQ